MSTSIRVLSSLTLVSLLFFACGGSSSSDAVDPRVAFAGAGGAGGANGSWGDISPGTGIPTEFVPGGGGTPTPPPPAIRYPEFLVLTNDGGNVMSLGIDDIGGLNFISSYDDGVSRPIYSAKHPSRDYIYTADFGTGALRAYSVNKTTGELSLIGTEIEGQNNPTAIVLSTNGDFLYLSNQATGTSLSTLTTFSVGANGGLTQLGVPQVASGLYYGLSFSPDGNYLYGITQQSGRVDIFRADPITGALESEGDVTTAGGRPFKIGFSLDGTLAFVSYGDVSFVSIYSYDASSGALEPVGSIPTAEASYRFTLHPTRPLIYVTTYQGNIQLFSYDASGGSAPIGSTVGLGGLSGDLAFNRNANYAYYTDYFSDTLYSFEVAADGTLTALADYGPEDFPGLDPWEPYNVVSNNNVVTKRRPE